MPWPIDAPARVSRPDSLLTLWFVEAAAEVRRAGSVIRLALTWSLTVFRRVLVTARRSSRVRARAAASSGLRLQRGDEEWASAGLVWTTSAHCRGWWLREDGLHERLAWSGQALRLL